MDKDFEILPHTADLQIRAYGKNIKELFCNALKGMFSSLGPEVIPDEKVELRTFDVSSGDRELLLVDFLSEALYLSDVYGEAYLDVEITEMSDTHIKGILHGTAITDFAAGEIKAVTHHGLKIVHSDDGTWFSEVIFDL
jgi:SHS2 domain-containing protein